MRFLMVSCGGLGAGGIQTVIMSIVRSLHNSITFDALLFTNEKRFYDDEFLSYGGKIHRIQLYEGKSRIKKRIAFLTRGINIYRQLCKIFKENPPYDAIHCNNNFESFICLKAAKKHNIPVRIAHSHSILNKSENVIVTACNILHRFFNRKYCNYMIGCSEEACIALFGKNEKWTVVNNPYNEDVFSRELYKENRRDDSSIHLLQVGYFCENKNQMFSLEILKNIIESGYDASLTLVGFGDYAEKIKKRIKSLNLETYVTLLPSDSNIPELLSQTDFFLFPSLQEGFGISLIEAQAMGVPCYVSDTVPKNTDVGGCTYMPLTLGAYEWAKNISKDYNNSHRVFPKYDCTKFASGTVSKIFHSIYKGEY